MQRTESRYAIVYKLRYDGLDLRIVMQKKITNSVLPRETFIEGHGDESGHGYFCIYLSDEEVRDFASAFVEMSARLADKE